MYHHYYIPLNKTFLLLFEPSPPSSFPSTSLSMNASINPVMVQVTVKPANDNLINEMAAFYLNQYEITVRVLSSNNCISNPPPYHHPPQKAIEVLIGAHISISTSDTGEMETIDIEGDDYMLSCSEFLSSLSAGLIFDVTSEKVLVIWKSSID